MIINGTDKFTERLINIQTEANTLSKRMLTIDHNINQGKVIIYPWKGTILRQQFILLCEG